jgi:hypothetical protein
MSFAIADRVEETTTTTGSGTTLNLAGAATQFQSFVNGVGSGNTCTICVLSGDGTSWEVIENALVTSGSPNTLTISAANVLAGSSGVGTLISLTSPSTITLVRSAASFRKTLCAPIVPPPIAASWTQKNFGTNTTVTDVANGTALFDSSTAAVTNQARAIVIAAPSTPYTIDANLCGIALNAATSEYFPFGVGWTDGTKVEYQGVYYEADSVIFGHTSVRTITTFTAAASELNAAYGLFNVADLWIRIADNATNISTFLSHDGVSWLPIYNVAKSSGFLGSSGYTNVGLFFEGGFLGSGSSGNVTLRSWWVH